MRRFLSEDPPARRASPEHALLKDAFLAALAAADPGAAILRCVTVRDDKLGVAGASYDLREVERLLVIGAGKATARMAQAIEALLDGRITAGEIIVKAGHTAPLTLIRQTEASHPIPDAAGVAGTRRILSLLHDVNDRTLVICLLSGGASALLVAPAAGLSLQDKQEATRLLLEAGATIDELNAVRKHLSAVKGGQLAQATGPARVLTLILSDVIGDAPGVIASGPTAADDTTYAEALSVIARHGLQRKMPAPVMRRLERGMAGLEAETLKPDAPCLGAVRNVIVAGLRQAIDAAEQKLRQSGIATRVISEALQGEARNAATVLARAARAERETMQAGEQRCLLCGGETTVTVRGAGRGGRNQELALAFALEIDGLPGITLLSAGTDGTDGPTDAAGAIVDGMTATKARQICLDPLQYLDANDSYTFFQQLDAALGTRSHIKTGPTGTNVTDIQIILVSR